MCRSKKWTNNSEGHKQSYETATNNRPGLSHDSYKNNMEYQSKGKCHICGRKNHKAINCEYKNYTCNVCDQVGHLASMCKNKLKPNRSKNKSNSHFLVNDDSNNQSDDNL